MPFLLRNKNARKKLNSTTYTRHEFLLKNITPKQFDKIWKEKQEAILENWDWILRLEDGSKSTLYQRPFDLPSLAKIF